MITQNKKRFKSGFNPLNPSGDCNTPLISLNNDVPVGETCPLSGLSLNLDYLQGFCTCEDIHSLISFLVKLEKTVTLDYTGKIGCYDMTARVKTIGEGVSIFYCQNDDIDIFTSRYSAYLQLSGEFFKKYELKDAIRILTGLSHTFNFRPTRIDIAQTDYRNTLNIQQMYDYALKDSHNTLCYLTYHKLITSGSYYKGEFHYSDTVYFGNSDKVVRVYDTLVKHGFSAIRFEGQYRNKVSEFIVSYLLMCTRSLDFSTISEALPTIEGFLSDFLLGTVDFRYKTDKNLERCERCDWWQNYLDYVSVTPQRFYIENDCFSMLNTLDWLQRQVFKTLAIIHEAKKSTFYEWLIGGISEAKQKFNSVDYLKIRLFREYFESQSG